MIPLEPHIPLLEALNKRFPLSNPTPHSSLAQVQRDAGKRDVIDFLYEELRNQRNEEGLADVFKPED